MCGDERRTVFGGEIASQSSEPEPEPEKKPNALAVRVAEIKRLPLADAMVEARELADDLLERSMERFEWAESYVTKLFHFVRVLRWHPELANLTAAEARRRVEAVLKAWTKGHGKSLGNDHWLTWFEENQEDARTAWIELWGKVRSTPGEDPLIQAWEKNQVHRLRLAPDARERRGIDSDTGNNYEAFIGLAGWLQSTVGDRFTISLPVHRLSDLFGVSAMTISRWRKWAVEDEYLEPVGPAKFVKGKPGAGHASTFKFDLSWYPILRERMQGGGA